MTGVAKKYIAAFLFITLLFVGILIHKDYGIPWDDPIQRDYGNIVYNYVTKGDEKLLKDINRYYGPIFELTLLSIEKTSGATSLSDVYEQRHLFIFLYFLLGIAVFYLALKKNKQLASLALIGIIFIILNPAVFAHSFYNSKDIPTMAGFMIAFYTYSRFYKDTNFKWAIIHGLTTAILIDIKIVGLLVFALSTTLVLLKTFTSKENSQNHLKAVVLFLLTTITLSILFWPTLWNKPLDTFEKAYRWLSSNPQSTHILYFGEKVHSSELPFHYIPGWISVTTPISILVLFISGVLVLLRKLFHTSLKGIRAFLTLHQEIFILGWLLVPLLLAMAYKTGFYDGWRHLYFIYPAIVFVALYGLKFILNHKYLKLFTAFIVLDLVLVANFMIRNHPYQHVYFNAFAGQPNELENKFELDYWGLSYRQALQWLAAYDSSEEIKIHVAQYPGETNVVFLSQEDQKRIISGSKLNESKYFITSYRGGTRDIKYPLIHSIKVNGNKIIGIYSLEN